jgi:3-oxoadipate enol-lactonase
MKTYTGTIRVIDGSILYYETQGKPSPKHPSLVFLHYYGGSPSTWVPVLSQSPFADFHTVCYHARGWAPSTGPPDPTAYGIEAASSDLSAILSATGLRDSRAGFILVGHSMGAKVAQYYAATAGSPHLKGLVLVAPAPLRGLELPEKAREQQRAAYQTAEGVEFVLNNVLTAAPGTLAEEVIADCVRDSLRGNEWAKMSWPDYALGEDYGDLMDKIEVPVLVLRGDLDFERDMVGSLGVDSGWINKDVKKCGHLIPLEQPMQLGREILAFVQELT